MNKRTLIALSLLGLFFAADWASGSGITVSAYNLIQSAGASLTKRSTLNFLGTGIACVDDAGNTRTNCTVNGAGMANYTQAFNSVTSVVANHGLGTTAVVVVVYDASTPPNVITPASVAITSASAVTVSFSTAQSGTVVVSGAPGGVPAPNVPICALYSVSYTNTAFVAASLTASVSLATLPARGKITGVTIKPTTAFSGAGIASATVSVGDGTVTYDQYASAYDVFQAPGNTVFQDSVLFKSTTMIASAINAHFIANSAFGTGAVTNLTTGAVDINVCSVTLP